VNVTCGTFAGFFFSHEPMLEAQNIFQSHSLGNTSRFNATYLHFSSGVSGVRLASEDIERIFAHVFLQVKEGQSSLKSTPMR
jgi:hypothetical protein